MCLFTCQKCKTTINQRETGTHVCETPTSDRLRDDNVALLAELLDAENRAGATYERLGDDPRPHLPHSQGAVMTDAFTTTDEALAEQIARALALENGYDPDHSCDEWAVDAYRGDAAAVLPIIRKAQADAWQAGVNFALPRAETTHFARHNPHRTEEDA